MGTNLNSAVLSAIQPNTVLRTGRIVQGGLTPATVQVSVGGSVITAGILGGYSPMVDDLVVVAKQDSSWLVLNTLQTDETPFDTGWITITLESGVVLGDAGATPSYRRVGNQLFFKGRVGITGGAAIPNAQSFFFMPVGFRPPELTASQGWAVERSSGLVAPSTVLPIPATRVDILSTTGECRLFDQSPTLLHSRPTWVGLSTISYFLDA